MTAGRKPKPTKMKLIAGNPGGRPLNESEPIPNSISEGPPTWFDAEHSRLWKKLVDSTPDGMLKELDLEVLTTFVVAVINHRKAVVELRKYGNSVLVETAQGGLKQNPLLVAIRSETQTIVRCASELGFSPTSRSRVLMEKNPGGSKKSKQENPFEKFAGKSKRR